MKNLKDISAHFTRLAGLITIVIGFLVMYGWVFNIPAFRSVLPGIAFMKLHATLSFILSWITLYLLNITVGHQCRKNSTCDFLLTEPKYHINEFNRLINEFMSKSLGGKSVTKLISFTICSVN